MSPLDPPGDDDAPPSGSFGSADLGVDDTVDGSVALRPETGSVDLDITATGSMPAIPLVAGRYQTLGLLGTGATGRVYRVHDTELDEIVALKVLRRELLDAPEVVERFRREVKLARRVTHPNVARTFDIGEHVGQRFMTMQYVDGESLRAIIRQRAPMSVGEAVRFGRMLCHGLAAAHAAGVVHRDLKPDNVLVDHNGQALITDFGIAHAFADDDDADAGKLLVGTPAYMSPEQVEGLVEPDGRADLYALGAILYELLTGARTWPGKSAIEVATARLTRPPTDPRVHRRDLPEDITGLVLRCLSRRPAGRPQSAARVAAELAAIAERDQAEATLPDPGASVELTPIGTATTDNLQTVAVLPIDPGSDPEIDYIADGITEDIIDTLSMTPGLRVRPLSAVQPHAGEDPRAVGRLLDVEVVVTGKLRRLGDQLRIRTRVMSVEDGFQLWAGRFRCDVGEVFEVSDEVAVAVAAAVTVEARPEATAAHGPRDKEAIDLFLQARYAMRRHWHEDVRGAITLFDEALRRAPDDPRILAGAAVARARMGFLGTGDADAAVLDQAVDLAARAIAAAPARSEPYFAMAMVRFNRGEPQAAVPMLEGAISRAPGDADAHDLLGRILAETGPADRAIRHLKSALLLDPASYNTRWDLARIHALAGDWENADALLALPVSDDQRAWVRGITRARTDLWRPSPRWLDGELPATGGGLMDPLIRLFQAVVTRGEVSPAQHDQVEEYAVAAAAAPRRALLMYQFAAELAGYAHDRKRAIARLDDAVQAGLTDRLWLTRCPRLTWLAADPQYIRLRATVSARLDG